MVINKVTNTAISKCVGTASGLVGRFSHSPMACGELEKQQLQMEPEKNPVELVQYEDALEQRVRYVQLSSPAAMAGRRGPI